MLRYTGLGTVMRTHCGLNRAYGAKQSWTTLGDDGIDLGYYEQLTSGSGHRLTKIRASRCLRTASATVTWGFEGKVSIRRRGSWQDSDALHQGREYLPNDDDLICVSNATFPSTVPLVRPSMKLVATRDARAWFSYDVIGYGDNASRGEVVAGSETKVQARLEVLPA